MNRQSLIGDLVDLIEELNNRKADIEASDKETESDRMDASHAIERLNSAESHIDEAISWLKN